jgi:hypothetical protein
MVQKYPTSKVASNEYALMAELARDRPSAHAAFDALNWHADPSVWGDCDVGKFRAWADWHP